MPPPLAVNVALAPLQIVEVAGLMLTVGAAHKVYPNLTWGLLPVSESPVGKVFPSTLPILD